MYHINAESKSVTNITQIAVFFAFFLCWFQVCLSNLKRFPRLAQSIPVHLHPNAVVALISTFHAIISTLLSALILYYDKDLGEHKLIYSSFMISFTLNFSMGYLLFDLLIMSVHRAQFEFQFVIHHFVSIVAFYCCSTHGVFPYIALARLTSEGSTPFLNIRWLLLTMNKKNSKWYTYNGLLLLIAFTCVRILTIVPIWYIFFTTMNTPEFHSIELKHKFVCVFSSSPLDVLNLFWWSKMIRMVRKSFFPQSSASAKKMVIIKQNQQQDKQELLNDEAAPQTSAHNDKDSYTKYTDE